MKFPFLSGSARMHIPPSYSSYVTNQKETYEQIKEQINKKEFLTFTSNVKTNENKNVFTKKPIYYKERKHLLSNY